MSDQQMYSYFGIGTAILFGISVFITLRDIAKGVYR